jgi:hypothetical protein
MKNLMNLGTILNKEEQKQVTGGSRCVGNGTPCGWHNGSYHGICLNGGCYMEG